MEITFILQRHGQTGQAERDMDRELTEEGYSQARQVEEHLYNVALSPADLVLASPARRVVNTVNPNDNEEVKVIEVDALYVTGYPKLDELFGRLRYAPLRQYFAEGGEEELTRWADAAHMAIIREITERFGEEEEDDSDDENEEDVFVRIGGHAILLNMLALRLGVSAEARERVLDLMLEEACCLVVYPDGEVELIEP